MNELLEDINALRRAMEALHKQVQAQGKPVSQAELAQLMQQAQQGVNYTVNGESIARLIQPHLTTPEKVQKVLTTGTASLEQVVNRIPSAVPVEGQVWGFTDWRLFLGTAGLVLTLTVATIFAWQGRSKAETRTEEVTGFAIRWRDSLAEERANYGWLAEGYLRLRKGNLKQAQKYFPPNSAPRKNGR